MAVPVAVVVAVAKEGWQLARAQARAQAGALVRRQQAQGRRWVEVPRGLGRVARALRGSVWSRGRSSFWSGALRPGRRKWTASAGSTSPRSSKSSPARSAYSTPIQQHCLPLLASAGLHGPSRAPSELESTCWGSPATRFAAQEPHVSSRLSQSSLNSMCPLCVGLSPVTAAGGSVVSEQAREVEPREPPDGGLGAPRQPGGAAAQLREARALPPQPGRAPPRGSAQPRLPLRRLGRGPAGASRGLPW